MSSIDILNQVNFREANSVVFSSYATSSEYHELYKYDGLAQQAVHVPVESAFSAGFTVDNSEIMKEMETLSALNKLIDLCGKSRLSGSFYIMPVLSYTRANSEKLFQVPFSEDVAFIFSEEGKKKYNNVTITSIIEMGTSDDVEIEDNILSKNYGMPKNINFEGTRGKKAEKIPIHHSRVFLMKGTFDGNSLFKSTFEQFKKFKNISQHEEIAVEEAYTTIVKTDIIAKAERYAKKAGADRSFFKNALTSLARAFKRDGNIKSVRIIDKGDEVIRIQSTNIPAITASLEFNGKLLAANVDVPSSRFVADKSGGLSVNKAEIAESVEIIHSFRRRIGTPYIEFIANIIANSKGIENYKIEWNETIQESMLEDL